MSVILLVSFSLLACGLDATADLSGRAASEATSVVATTTPPLPPAHRQPAPLVTLLAELDRCSAHRPTTRVADCMNLAPAGTGTLTLSRALAPLSNHSHHNHNRHLPIRGSGGGGASASASASAPTCFIMTVREPVARLESLLRFAHGFEHGRRWLRGWGLERESGDRIVAALRDADDPLHANATAVVRENLLLYSQVGYVARHECARGAIEVRSGGVERAGLGIIPSQPPTPIRPHPRPLRPAARSPVFPPPHPSMLTTAGRRAAARMFFLLVAQVHIVCNERLTDDLARLMRGTFGVAGFTTPHAHDRARGGAARSGAGAVNSSLGRVESAALRDYANHELSADDFEFHRYFCAPPRHNTPASRPLLSP